LMIRSFARLNSIDPGFDPAKLLSLRIQLPASKYGQNPQRIAFFKQLSDRVQSLPGVSSVGAVSFLPFAGGGAATSILIDGRPEPPPGQRLTGDVRVVDGGYFETMGIPLLQGRSFTERELTQASHVVVINEAMARDFFPGEDPIGKRVTINMQNENVPNEIIGVVRDVRHAALETPARAMTYWPYPELAYSGMTLVVRAETEPLALAETLRQQVLALDSDQPIADVSTMNQLLADSTSRARFSTMLLVVFAGVALVLAAVGIFGVMSYGVSERTHEIGLRMALGAQPSDVRSMIVRQGMVLTLIGIVTGLTAAFGLTRVMISLLYGVSATDPLTFAVISIVLVFVALSACYLPARRATKVDPMIAIRYE
jgi:putative ABC transport system permease protein